jgi:hypothetical protein
MASQFRKTKPSATMSGGGCPACGCTPALLLRSGLGRSLLSETAKRSFP